MHVSTTTSLPNRVIALLRSSPLIRRIARKMVQGRNVTIPSGVGTGLKFNAGSSNPAYALGTNELPVQKTLAQYLSGGQVFFDIGANVGFFTVIGAKLVGPTGHVFAFEPVAQNAKVVRRNVELNHFSNVTLLEKAVSNEMGVGTLLIAEYSGGSALETAGAPPDVSGSTEIELVSIDGLLASEVLPPPSFVKIDVEGAEADVLRGMKVTLTQYRPLVIFEVDDESEIALRQKYDLCCELLASAGYSITVLEDSYPDAGWYVKNALAQPIEQSP